MSEQSTLAGSSVIPTVRYRDVAAAIAWLQRAFGLMPHRIVKGADGVPLYAELTFGTGMVMIAPIQDSPFGKLMVQPDEIGGAETQVCYLLVDDLRAHYARAKTAGADILFDLDAEPDSNGYSCRDLEGHVWNIGTYDPWVAEPADDAEPAHSPRRRKALAAGVALLITTAVLALFHPPAREAGEMALNMLSEVPPTIEQAQANADAAVKAPREQGVLGPQERLANEQQARLAAERQIQDLRQQLAEERSARETAELAARNVHQAHAVPPPAPAAGLQAAEAAAAQARSELATVQAALRVALDRAAQAETAKAAAVRSAEAANQKLASVGNKRRASDPVVRQARAIALRERRRRIRAERILRIAKTSPYTPFPLDDRRP